LVREADPVFTETWTLENAEQASNQSVALVVFDAQGESRDLTVYLQHVAVHRWALHFVEQGPEGPSELGTDTLDFGPNPGMSALVHVSGASRIELPIAQGIPTPAITLDFGLPVGTDGASYQFVSIDGTGSTLFVGANGRAATPPCP
jgi:hypothetical protein